MKLYKLALPIIAIVTVGACATMKEKMMPEKEMEEGISATDCFSAGGTIDSSGEQSMCVMGEDERKPIL